MHATLATVLVLATWLIANTKWTGIYFTINNISLKRKYPDKYQPTFLKRVFVVTSVLGLLIGYS